MPDSNEPRVAWTDSERAALDAHRAQRAEMRRTQAVNDAAHADDDRNATAGIYRLLSIQDARLDAMTLHHETLAQQVFELSQNQQRLEARMPELMAQGLASAIGNPETWVKGRQAMQEAASKAAGGWLFGLLGGIAKQALLFLLLLAVAYQTGGLSALLAVLKLKSGAP